MFLSYLIIPTVILVLILNIVFRIKIIRQYKALRNKEINIDPKILLNKVKLNEVVSSQYPEHREDLMRFSKLLRQLLMIAVLGFLAILCMYLIVKFSN